MTILRGLVGLGANVNTDNKDWPRSSFSFDKHPHDMEKLASTSTKATLPATISGITPLMKAASLRDREIMEFLIENGADSTTTREDGQTATTILESAEKAKGKKPTPKKPKKSVKIPKIVQQICCPCYAVLYFCGILWMACTGKRYV
ncbi:hypothetical protein DL96DRAFT_1562988 [Flagelloscypha sp. PMI_526]|nr:hypothetical protein DL96DRAFT_1562988 [Flagelloscypha sp. PMI_526]